MTDIPQGIDNPTREREKILPKDTNATASSENSLQLEEVEGFKQLSEKQRRFILDSLAVEARARSGELQAQRAILGRTCFDSIAQLEGYFDDMNVDDTTNMAPPDFYTAREFRQVKDVGATVKTATYPSVVLIQTASGSHGFVALGERPDNEVLVWEKAGPGMPFRVTTLDEEIKSYPGDSITSFRMRPLRVIPPKAVI